jgi:hypothetical protein
MRRRLPTVGIILDRSWATPWPFRHGCGTSSGAGVSTKRNGVDDKGRCERQRQPPRDEHQRGAAACHDDAVDIDDHHVVVIVLVDFGAAEPVSAQIGHCQGEPRGSRTV